MKYKRISADSHIDLCWMPPNLFASEATPAMKDRMPYVTDGPDGPYWTSKNGISFGLKNGVGPDFNMIPWNDRLTDDDVWNVVNYLKSIAK